MFYVGAPNEVHSRGMMPASMLLLCTNPAISGFQRGPYHNISLKTYTELMASPASILGFKYFSFLSDRAGKKEIARQTQLFVQEKSERI